MCLAATMLVVLPGKAALGHGGPVKLDVAGDGAGGVTVRALDERDGHPVEEPLRLVLTAKGESGRTAGPIQLAASPEGRGFYSSGQVLTPGHWDVTVRAPPPHLAEATAAVRARAPQSPPAPAVDARQPAASGAWWWLWLAGGTLALVATAAVLLINGSATTWYYRLRRARR
ncbi:hypothetical protein [Allorhizocola rhizosphaerae]|uniref:hypothetical protein n=1 Tax=Allorhizocola rhizosphaerae TaxID=1872709 RepID=UPI000E3C4270|nr:hypothetical protein [Allorhizocola rhizosphaerae]